MIGYKIFNPDWTCRDFQYKVGKTYEMEESPKCCERGFHFCETIIDCLKNSPYFHSVKEDKKLKCAIIEALGEIDRRYNIICTNKIKIVKEIPIEEILENVNIGKDNVGYENVGNYNEGNGNVGNCNIGNFNVGSNNVGYKNVGIDNRGNNNTGSGNYGDMNTGTKNDGDSNAGVKNVGDFNTGDCNIGNYNVGDFNKGSYNTGSFNNTNHSTGFFNTKTEKVRMFNKPTNLTYEQAKDIIDNVRFIVLSLQSGASKWGDLFQKDRESILALPNFDAEIFKEITGVDVNENISSM